MARILFLDIDGVVLHGEALRSGRGNRYLPPEKISHIADVCSRAGAVIVVSSTWRRSDETLDQLRAVGLPVHSDWRTDFGPTYRGDQIGRWLKAHPETEVYAIVDDDDDMLPEQMRHFVQTPFVTGIAQKHVDRLVSILNMAK